MYNQKEFFAIALRKTRLIDNFMDYALVPTIPVLLERSSLEQRWGFRLQGGADFRLPLSVKKITTNSPSHNKLHVGDAFAFIDGLDTRTMTHEDAQQLMSKALRLQVILRRGQLNLPRRTQSAVKFTSTSNHRAHSALYKTQNSNNYRRF